MKEQVETSRSMGSGWGHVIQPELVFWQNALSIHQAPLIRAMSEGLGLSVMVVVPGGISESRRAMGWDVANYGKADIRVTTSKGERRALVESTRGAHGHVFSGLGSYPEVDRAFTALVARRHGKIAVFTESWDPRGWKSILRKLRFEMRLGLRDRHIDTYFLTGIVARDQFSSLGIDSAKFADFGYFVSGSTQVLGSSVHSQFALIYVASFEPRKNPLGLIRALSQLMDLDWTLTMVGSGRVRESAINLIRSLQMQERVKFIPNLDNAAVQSLIGQNDLCVLPSTYDGWGAVINESLMSGTPVAASSACGSSILVRSTLQGDVFDPASVESLAALLRKRIEQGKITEVDRSRLMAWASSHISPEVAASYLWSRINSNIAVEPPWLSGDDSGEH